MSKIVLGLDISTTCIGVSEYDLKGRLISLKHLKFGTSYNATPVEHRPLVKAEAFKDYIGAYKGKEIEHVFIEDPLNGSNNVMTVNTLLRFNGICSFLILQELGIMPRYMTVHNVRKTLCPELLQVKKGKVVLSTPKGFDMKEHIFQKVKTWYPHIEWLYTKNNTMKKENYDMSDSAALTLASLIEMGLIEYSAIGGCVDSDK
jgi:hypothetical protein